MAESHRKTTYGDRFGFIPRANIDAGELERREALCEPVMSGRRRSRRAPKSPAVRLDAVVKSLAKIFDDLAENPPSREPLRFAELEVPSDTARMLGTVRNGRTFLDALERRLRVSGGVD